MLTKILEGHSIWVLIVDKNGLLFLNCFKSEITINSKHVEAYNNNNTAQGSCSTFKKQFLYACVYILYVCIHCNKLFSKCFFLCSSTFGSTTLKIFLFQYWVGSVGLRFWVTQPKLEKVYVPTRPRPKTLRILFDL